MDEDVARLTRQIHDRVRRYLQSRGKLDEEGEIEAESDDALATCYAASAGQDRVRGGSGLACAQERRSRQVLTWREWSSRFSPRSLLTPAEAIVSRIVADVVEYDFIVDVHVLQRNERDVSQEKQTLVVWVRKIDLEEEEAAIGVGERVLAAVREVFQRR